MHSARITTLALIAGLSFLPAVSLAGPTPPPRGGKGTHQPPQLTAGDKAALDAAKGIRDLVEGCCGKIDDTTKAAADKIRALKAANASTADQQAVADQALADIKGIVSDCLAKLKSAVDAGNAAVTSAGGNDRDHKIVDGAGRLGEMLIKDCARESARRLNVLVNGRPAHKPGEGQGGFHRGGDDDASKPDPKPECGGKTPPPPPAGAARA